LEKEELEGTIYRPFVDREIGGRVDGSRYEEGDVELNIG